MKNWTTAQVQKLGRSLAVVIPKTLAREFGLREGMRVDLSTDGSSIVLRKSRASRPRRPLRAIVTQMEPRGCRRHNRDLLGDMPVGQEIW